MLYARFFGALSHKEIIRFNYYFSSIPLLGKINFTQYSRFQYTLNFVRSFLLFIHSTKFQYFFYGFKSQLSNSHDNWYVQKYLRGIFHKGMLLIWKEYFTHAILSFSSPRCAIIARLNVIYAKFRRGMIAQLNKIWRVWACVRAI